MTGAAQAADEDIFLGQPRASLEQTMGQGQTALWTLPLVATQYQPLQPTPAMQQALQAQNENRFLDALILLDDASKSGLAGADTLAEISLLRASFLLQGNQIQQALEVFASLLAQTKYAADAYALTAMAYLQQGQMQQALEAAQHAHDAAGGVLQHLTLSYALQGMGRLAEASVVIHDFNAQTPQAITLAREAELALTLDQIPPAKSLVSRAEAMDAAHPYVVAVSGLAHLIDGQSAEAKAAFEKALKRDPKDAKALLGLGLAEIKLGNFQAGQKKLQAADEVEPGNALILTYLGRAQQQAGQTAEAMASWRSAQRADPKDPTPWLYQAQAELQANRLAEARENLRQAQARAAYRSVYRGANLLREDEQLLQANLAEIQRRSGLESLAFHTLSDPVGEINSAALRNQADLLQGRRFGESERRSLLLQSLFGERPGNLPAELDIYGDGAGQTGATAPQHGAVSGLSAQQASYNNYDSLFTQRITLEADAITGNQNTNGEQIRLGVGNGTLGLGIALRQYKTDGNVPFTSLDNQIAQGVVQWQPSKSTQAFVSHQAYNSKHGETLYPADAYPCCAGFNAMIEDSSRVTRLGMRHTLTDYSELRGLWSHQQTDQLLNAQDFSVPPLVWANSGSSYATSAELQYRRSGADHATQWGGQQSNARTTFQSITFGNTQTDNTLTEQRLYAARQQTLSPCWQLDAELEWGKMENHDNSGAGNSTFLKRWLPKLGVVYAPDATTHVRLAAWEGMSFSGVGNATLAPVSLAGILLTRTSDNNSANGKLVHAVALAADRQLSSAWLLDGNIQQRRIDLPYISNSAQLMFNFQVDESKLALHWQPQRIPMSVSLAYDYEQVKNDPFNQVLDSVQDQSMRSQQLTMSWFASAQWTVNLKLSHNQVAGMLQINYNTPPPLPFQDSFNQVDANLSWQINRSGLLTAGVRNATDKSSRYMDTDRYNPRFSNGRLVYAKLKLAW